METGRSGELHGKQQHEGVTSRVHASAGDSVMCSVKEGTPSKRLRTNAVMSRLLPFWSNDYQSLIHPTLPVSTFPAIFGVQVTFCTCMVPVLQYLRSLLPV